MQRYVAVIDISSPRSIASRNSAARRGHVSGLIGVLYDRKLYLLAVG